jgi:hypothetical protein
MIAKTTFGNGKAELYLVDTLNQLERSKNVAARCQKMISTQRDWCAQLNKLWRSKQFSTAGVAHIVTLSMKEHATICSQLNRELDAELAAWEHLLTDEGYIRAQLKARALKLAMNISTAALKELYTQLTKSQREQQATLSRLYHFRRQVNVVNTEKYKLEPTTEIQLLKDLMKPVSQNRK